MIEGLQKGRHGETINSCHEHSEGDYYAGNVDGESSVVEESVEHYAHRLAAGNNAEYVEGNGKVEGCGTGEANGEGAENGE